MIKSCKITFLHYFIFDIDALLIFYQKNELLIKFFINFLYVKNQQIKNIYTEK